MKMLKLFVGSLLAVTTLAACGKSDGGGSNNGTVCNGTIINGVCQTGTVIYPPTTNTGTGKFGVVSLVQGTNNGDALRAFLRNGMGVCDVATWNWGDSRCDNWLSGQWDVNFTYQRGATSGIVTLRVYPNLSGLSLSAGIYSPMGASCGVIYSYGRNYPYCEISFNSTASLINNSQGIELRTYGAMHMPSNRSLLQLQATDLLTSRQDGTYSARVFFPSNGSYQQIFGINNIGQRQ